MDNLLANNERLSELSHQKEELVTQAVLDLRGLLTNLNLRLYLLEHTAPDTRGQHIDSLKETAADLTDMVEDLLAQVRQCEGNCNTVPLDDLYLDGMN